MSEAIVQGLSALLSTQRDAWQQNLTEERGKAVMELQRGIL